MRTKTQVAAVQMQSTHPSVITGSHDTTIKMWDLVAGKYMTTLTHHQRSIRAICKPSLERTLIGGVAQKVYCRNETTILIPHEAWLFVSILRYACSYYRECYCVLLRVDAV
jgi:WD40 repeat protein